MKFLKSTTPSRQRDARRDECYAFGPFRLNCKTRQLLRADEAVALTPKAFDTLRVLVTFCDRVVEKGELMKLVWPDSFVGEETLTQNIATLRKALGDASDQPHYIGTVSRRGYRFVAAVQDLSDPVDLAPAPEQLEVPPAAGRPGQMVEFSDESHRASSEAPPADRTKPPQWARRWIAIATVAMLVAISLAVAYLVRRAPSTTAPVMRFVVTAPEGTSFSPSASFLAMSPNGRVLAFLAARPGEDARIWVRSLDSLIARELTGTDGALGPFWSPDSRYLGFVAKGQLKTVSLLGEPPRVLCDVQQSGVVPPSGAWNRDGVILFSQATGIARISWTGGMATPVTSIDQRRGETVHLLPHFLPDGRHFVYVARGAAGGSINSWIVLKSLDAPDDRQLLRASSQAVFADPGYLMFLRDGALLAQPFDWTRLQLGGEPLPVPEAEHVGFNSATPRGMFSMSETGVLAYRTAAVAELGWVDRAGKPLGWVGAPGLDTHPALSPDGQRLAVSRYDPETSTRNLWILDLRRGGTATRLTARPSWETCPVWSPDGTRIMFAAGVTMYAGELFEKNVDGTTDERSFTHHLRGCPLDWSRDGRYVLYGTVGSVVPPVGGGLWLAPVRDEGDPTPLAGTFASRPQARISPDSRWIAYVSETSGRNEIWVRSFPDGRAGNWQVSSHGGIEPQWRADGQELFFIAADSHLMAVPVTAGNVFRTGTPTTLFSTDLDPSGRLGIVGRNQYLVTTDGQRFLINQPRSGAGPSPVTVLVNWTAALKK